MAVAVSAIAQTRTKMRVLIASLFKKQLEMMRREFPDLEINATVNEIKGRNNLSSKVQLPEADRVIVLTRFVGHGMESAIRSRFDMSKVIRLNGAMTDLRRTLASYAAFSRMQMQSAPAVRAVQIATPDDALVDYSAFRTCKPGDVLEFIRPEHVAAHVFAQNVNEARRFYETNGGVQSQVEIKGGKARVSILDRVRPMLEQAEAELLGAPSEFALSFEDQCALEELFRDVYALSVKLSPHANASHHATVANIAVDGWLEMFKTTGGP